MIVRLFTIFLDPLWLGLLFLRISSQAYIFSLINVPLVMKLLLGDEVGHEGGRWDAFPLLLVHILNTNLFKAGLN